MIYPQGNWVEIGQGTPYQIIGASGYGKPVLDRTLKYTDSIAFALKVGRWRSIPPGSALRTSISRSTSWCT